MAHRLVMKNAEAGGAVRGSCDGVNVGMRLRTGGKLRAERYSRQLRAVCYVFRSDLLQLTMNIDQATTTHLRKRNPSDGERRGVTPALSNTS